MNTPSRLYDESEAMGAERLTSQLAFVHSASEAELTTCGNHVRAAAPAYGIPLIDAQSSTSAPLDHPSTRVLRAGRRV
jgi:hypothetical protein